MRTLKMAPRTFDGKRPIEQDAENRRMNLKDHRDQLPVSPAHIDDFFQSRKVIGLNDTWRCETGQFDGHPIEHGCRLGIPIQMLESFRSIEKFSSTLARLHTVE